MKSGTPGAWHKGGTPEKAATDNMPSTTFPYNWLSNVCLLPDRDPRVGPVFVTSAPSALCKAGHGVGGNE